MAKITILFAVLLVLLGAGGYYWKESLHAAALYPDITGILLAIFGVAAISPSEKRRKIFMHVNVTIGLLGFLLSAGMALNGYGSARSAGEDVDMNLLYYRLSMAVVLLVYIQLCIRSFIAARAKLQQD
jgi:hypothetical protein